MLDTGVTIRDARTRAGLSQAELARRAGTSQATVSAYEAGRKQPSLATLERILAAAGVRLTTRQPPYLPSQERLARNARTLEDVLALAEQLPVRHARRLEFPRLPG